MTRLVAASLVAGLGVGPWALGTGPLATAPGPIASIAYAVQDRPLPDADTFYRMVRENLARAERVTHLYTYKERRTDIHTNPFGKLGTSGESLFEVYPSPTRRLGYRRLVARNGKPIPAADLAEQDQRVPRSRCPGDARKRVSNTRSRGAPPAGV